MKEEQIKIIENCIAVLRSTLGNMTASDADRAVRGVAEILQSAINTLRQLK